MRSMILPSFVFLAFMSPQAPHPPATSTQQSRAAKPAAAPCRVSKGQGITVLCQYSAFEDAEAGSARIVVTRARLAFNPTDESHMQVQLVFKNRGSQRLDVVRQTYLAVDDDSGQNYIRRPLPTVDLNALAPGATATFSETLLVAALRPKRYTIHLWIPNADPSLKFDPSKNLLLSNSKMADPATGLNTLGTFAVPE